MGRNICFAPPGGSTSMLLTVSSICLAASLFGVIVTEYKAQFYSESEVTQGLYFGASIFFWLVFVFSLALICFSLMQRKHLQHVSADYPEIDLRTGRKGKFLLGCFIVAILACGGGFAAGIFGIHYMDTRTAVTLNWTIDETDPVDLEEDGNLLQLSIQQTVQSETSAWSDVQDRLGCCSWSNVTDEYATGYCCTNADHECPESPVPCREPWLDEMGQFNLQVCVLLLLVGGCNFFGLIALAQLRFFSRSSLFKYSAYGGSISEKRAREKAAVAAVNKAADDAAKKIREGRLDDNDVDEKANDEAEKQPLTGGSDPEGGKPKD